ncbi:putative endo-1,4-beta-xylanase [Helianthus annuus]|nr:putative endo-1,4-beta-xylanase [Helianthus annuus]KAJ0696712.1 putative endo-1,4-beta-xylanase [Helianthus annuus]KAJ0879416.1 putative endo-1,4-beta-xylanase [Helianthus annuus]
MAFSSLLVIIILYFSSLISSSPNDSPLYDYTAYTQCKIEPEDPLYNGGILQNEVATMESIVEDGITTSWPAFVLPVLTSSTFYSFSSWIKIHGSNSSLISARLMSGNSPHYCVGTVVARRDCWSFLKGGFYMDSESNPSLLYFQNSEDKETSITIASASLQPFTKEQWSFQQQYKINTERKRAVTIHVSDKQGARLRGAMVRVEQVAKDFPFGSAINNYIIGNLPYQKWFVERFNAAVFENELKWAATEPKQGVLNYTLADQMLDFVRANQIVARGHNIFWEDPKYIPSWVLNLSNSELELAVKQRIASLMTRYKNEFVHWDVSNEFLHFNFYEDKLGENATYEFFKAAHEADPLATLFMNDFNVVESCRDVNSTVDSYISKMRDLRRYGVYMDGIGLESHFGVPNLPLMRAILDKLATLELPIWLTEVDISDNFDHNQQAAYLEDVLREGFSHPSVNGIMLWSALKKNGKCYQMCLTDTNFNNLPAGDTVDKLLKEWQTGVIKSQTDEHGAFSFYGYLGEYAVTASFGGKTTSSTFSVSRSDETRHYSIQI